MIATTPEIENYRAQLEALEDSGAAGPSWLTSIRRSAGARFIDLGFPTQRHEEWKYTNVLPLAQIPFQPAAYAPETLTLPDVDAILGPEARCRLVFVNGFYAPQLSHVENLPRSVTVGSLATTLAADPASVEPHLARYAQYDDHTFVALNTALMQDGAYVHIPRGLVVEEPIHVLFYSTASGAPTVTHPRNLFVAEETSQATVVETYYGAEGGVYFTNVVTEIVVAENANFDHYKVQRESEAAYHIATQQLQQARSSVFSSHNISFGGSLVRNDINGVLDGEGIESTVNGLYVVNGRQHVDNHTTLVHAKPHCNSHELYKGIMDGRATAAFNGKIFVRKDAQKTDAKQTNQNLLLSRDATINTKPQLEIFADDVRCTHGATIGQLDADALFYMRARGIGEAEARGLLVYAFASDLLSRIRIESLRNRLERLLFEKLPKDRQ